MANIGICPYCKEPTDKTELGFVKAIHSDHQAGTSFWVKWYKGEKVAGRYQSPIADLILSVAESRMVGAAAGLAKMQAINKQRAQEEASSNPGVKKINPGLLRMQELNRLRKAQKEKVDA